MNEENMLDGRGGQPNRALQVHMLRLIIVAVDRRCDVSTSTYWPPAFREWYAQHAAAWLSGSFSCPNTICGIRWIRGSWCNNAVTMVSLRFNAVHWLRFRCCRGALPNPRSMRSCLKAAELLLVTFNHTDNFHHRSIWGLHWQSAAWILTMISP